MSLLQPIAAAPLMTLACHSSLTPKLLFADAATTPSHDFPHHAAWGFVEALLRTFGAGRLCWGSDFSPALSHLTFQQTIDLFARMPFLDAEQRRAVEGGNLIQWLDEAAAAGPRL